MKGTIVRTSCPKIQITEFAVILFPFSKFHSSCGMSNLGTETEISDIYIHFFLHAIHIKCRYIETLTLPSFQTIEKRH